MVILPFTLISSPDKLVSDVEDFRNYEDSVGDDDDDNGNVDNNDDDDDDDVDDIHSESWFCWFL